MDSSIAGDEPLADGMRIAVRLRRDFTVTDAPRLLAAARAAYARAHPGAEPGDVAAAVTSAADAIFTILESDGLLGDTASDAIASHVADGLQPDGWQAQVTLNEAHHLQPGTCFNPRDVFALPADR